MYCRFFVTKILPKSLTGIKIVWIHIRECKWVQYQHNVLLFYQYDIITAIFNRLNLRLSQKSDSLDTFLKINCALDNFWRMRSKNNLYVRANKPFQLVMIRSLNVDSTWSRPTAEDYFGPAAVVNMACGARSQTGDVICYWKSWSLTDHSEDRKIDLISVKSGFIPISVLYDTSLTLIGWMVEAKDAAKLTGRDILL